VVVIGKVVWAFGESEAFQAVLTVIPEGVLCGEKGVYGDSVIVEHLENEKFYAFLAELGGIVE
jgi:hypothetical protein